MYVRYGKRLFDVFVVLLTLPVVLPMMLVTAAMIKISDAGPLLFVQERVGQNGRVFQFYKFRSMPTDTCSISSDQLGTVELSWVGRFIRRTNIDELPQLMNVWSGDMSIVGPRPPITTQHELVKLRRANGAICCQPGLTGLAQINSFDGMSVVEKARFDGIYASRITFFQDMKIVLRTFAYLLKKPPVY